MSDLTREQIEALLADGDWYPGSVGDIIARQLLAAMDERDAALAREAALREALSAAALLAALPYESSGQRIVGLMTIATMATDTLNAARTEQYPLGQP